jgi:hypothetical protein
VVVKHENGVSTRARDALVERGLFALIFLTHIGNRRSELPHHALGVVCGSVVDDEDFAVRICLGENRLDSLCEQFGTS